MMESSIFVAAADEDFKAEALADYLNDVSESYANLVALFNEVVDMDEVEDENGDIIVEEDLAQIDGKIQLFDLDPDMSLTLPGGFTKLKEALVFARTAALNYADLKTTDPVGELVQAKFTLRDGTGALDSSLKTSYADLIDDIKSTYHSITACAATAYASLESNIGDRIAVFNDNMQRHFANAYTDISNFGSLCKNLLAKSREGAASICQSLITAMNGIQRPSFLKDSETYSVTGAAPIAAVDFKFATSAVTAVGGLIVSGVKAFFTGIFNKLGQLGIKAKNYKEQLENPLDLYIYDTRDDSQPSVAIWNYEYHKDAIILPFNMTAAQEEVVRTWLDNHANKWMKYKFFFGEVLYRYESAVIVSPLGVHSIGFNNLDLKFKPYVLNRTVVNNALSRRGVTWNQEVSVDYVEFDNWTASDWVDFITELKSHPEIYITDLTIPVGSSSSDVEYELLMGLDMAVNLGYSIIHCGAIEISHTWSDTEYDFASQLCRLIRAHEFTPHLPVTNLNFAQAASGYATTDVGNFFTFDSEHTRFLAVFDRVLPQPAGYVPSRDGYVDTQTANFFFDIFGSFMIQALDRASRPIDYAFLPYRNDMDGFDNSIYAIKTDEQNQAAFTAFLTVVVAVVIIAATAAVAANLINKIKRRSYFKKAQFVGQCDNAMWNSASKRPVMDKKQQRKYVRYARKLNASNLIADGVQSVTSNTASSLISSIGDVTTTNDAVSISTLMSAIVGDIQ